MADGYDVTVRVPVTSESMAELAGWINAIIDEGMRDKFWIGTSAAVLFRKDGNGPIIMFHEGMVDPYTGVLPHDLVERPTELTQQDQKVVEALNNLKDSINEAKIAFHEMVVEVRNIRRERRNRKK